MCGDLKDARTWCAPVAASLNVHSGDVGSPRGRSPARHLVERTEPPADRVADRVRVEPTESGGQLVELEAEVQIPLALVKAAGETGRPATRRAGHRAGSGPTRDRETPEG